MNMNTLDDRLRFKSRSQLNLRSLDKSIAPADVLSGLQERIMGQSHAIDEIVPYVRAFQAGLSPENRPAGVFLLLGPTGTGKTRTVEALAEVLHGSARNILKIDCAEFQMEHEVAKLIGAPPGYLGHRETHPVLTQAKLASVASERCGVSIVLFDEIEKAAPTLTRLLLGILDKATLRLGDNNTVNFEKTLIFLTSNIGARRIMKQLAAPFGFGTGLEPEGAAQPAKLDQIAINAARRQFSPEFMNRIDAVVTYRPLDGKALRSILDQQIDDLQNHVFRRLGARAFKIFVQSKAKSFLLKEGTSLQYGAREIKRTVHRRLAQPIAIMVAEGRVAPGASVYADVTPKGDRLKLRAA
jgi:ATP-dependent Clp protease ATP-binding subunit ClpA